MLSPLPDVGGCPAFPTVRPCHSHLCLCLVVLSSVTFPSTRLCPSASVLQGHLGGLWGPTRKIQEEALPLKVLNVTAPFGTYRKIVI